MKFTWKIFIYLIKQRIRPMDYFNKISVVLKLSHDFAIFSFTYGFAVYFNAQFPWGKNQHIHWSHTSARPVSNNQCIRCTRQRLQKLEAWLISYTLLWTGRRGRAVVELEIVQGKMEGCETQKITKGKMKGQGGGITLSTKLFINVSGFR